MVQNYLVSSDGNECVSPRGPRIHLYHHFLQKRKLSSEKHLLVEVCNNYNNKPVDATWKTRPVYVAKLRLTLYQSVSQSVKY